MKNKILPTIGAAVLLTAAVAMNPFVKSNLHFDRIMKKQNEGWYYSEDSNGSYNFYYDADNITEELYIPESLTFDKGGSPKDGRPPKPGTYPMHFGGFRTRQTDGLIAKFFQSFNNRIVTIFPRENKPDNTPNDNSNKKELLKKVTVADGASLSSCCFQRCTNLSEIRLPTDLTDIPEYCFQNCESLEYIEIPDSVTRINAHAFAFSGLNEITLPASVNMIDDGAFSYCSQLLSVTILNPDCDFGSSDNLVIFNIHNSETDFFGSDPEFEFYGKICGYTGSTAEILANNNGYRFSSLGERPDAPDTDNNLPWLDDFLDKDIEDNTEDPDDIFSDDEILKVIEDLMESIENDEIVLPDDSDSQP